MKYKAELDSINDFIDNFDPDEFSTKPDQIVDDNDEQSKHLLYVQRYKARMKRKKQMEETFLENLETNGHNHSDVTISQTQIDDLLASLDL